MQRHQSTALWNSATLFLFSTWFVVLCSALTARADGCFVFKWNKTIDINEPTQKAIILHDAGREDMLLQVKYEGPLEEFGWLIPVPSVPQVEKGAMDAFYELSELTQRGFGGRGGDAKGLEVAAAGRGSQSVKLIETKTVGAYEIAILSARDAGSLERWLKANDYSLPEAKTELVNDYIQRGWYFIAAKIHLNGRGEVKLVAPGAKNSAARARAQALMQKKLASGELHPLLISFDTPQCVFPLKISAVAGKPSEVSLYVLSEEPLLNRFHFDEACKTLEQQWGPDKIKPGEARRRSMENLQVIGLAHQLTPIVRSPDGRSETRPDPERKWSVEDLQAMVREGAPPQLRSFDDLYASGDELLHCIRVEINQLPKSSRSMPRLRKKSWYVTKVTRTFAAAEMHDLEFEAAAPRLSQTLSRPAGRSAAIALARFGTNGSAALITACQSKDSVTRVNAALGLEQVRDTRAIGPLLTLLKDEIPEVRLHAVRAAARNWDKRFTEPLSALFRDSHPEIRSEATECLSTHETRDRIPVYLEMANSSEPKVQCCALRVLLQLDRDSIPSAPIIGLLKDMNPEVQNCGLHLLWKVDRDAPREVLLPLLNSAWMENISVAVKLIEGDGQVQSEFPKTLANFNRDYVRSAQRRTAQEHKEQKRLLSSAEAVGLTTNRLSRARLMGLQVLERNGGIKAIELTLPLLRDPNPIVRSRAFSTIKTLTGQTLSDSDAASWERWWSTNKPIRVQTPGPAHQN